MPRIGQTLNRVNQGLKILNEDDEWSAPVHTLLCSPNSSTLLSRRIQATIGAAGKISAGLMRGMAFQLLAAIAKLQQPRQTLFRCRYKTT